jgi:RNA polymerase sigma factor (sigma-70 family)
MALQNDLRDDEGCVIAPSRPAARTLTPNFEEVWPEVAHRVSAMLRRRRLSPEDLEDVLQETAARAISRRVPNVDSDDLFRWAVVVARNLAIDRFRRRKHVELVELADGPTATDVAQEAEARVVLGTVVSRFSQLSPRDRVAILSAFGPATGGRTGQVRVAVARHRARERLRALVDGLTGVIAWTWRRLPRARGVRIAIAAVCFAAPALWVVFEATRGHAGEPPPPSQSAPAVLNEPVPHGVNGPPANVAPGWRAVLPNPEVRTPPRMPTGTQPAAVRPLRVELVPTPYGRGHIAVRPARPDDHLVCVSVPGQPDRCADPPLPVSLPLP